MPRIYPCRCPEGHFLQGEPATVRDVPRATAEHMVTTLAYTWREDGLHAPPAETSTPTPEGPADAGPRDS